MRLPLFFRKHWVGFSVLGVVLLGCGGALYWWRSQELPLDQIRRLVINKEFNKAEKLIQTLGKDLVSTERQELLAEIRLGEGRHEGALNALAKLSQEEQASTRARILIGRAMLGLGRTSLALDSFQKAYLSDPKNSEAARGLAAALYDLGALDEALGILDRYLKTESDALAFRFAGQIAKELVQNDQASDFFQQALKLDLPLNTKIEVAIDLVETELLRNAVGGARAFWDQFASIIPEGPRGLEVLGELLLVEGQLDQAEKALATARDMDLISPRIARLRAQVHMAKNQNSDAVVLLEFATTADPLDSKGWNELAAVYDLLGKPNEAKTARKNLVEATADLKRMSDLYQLANSRPGDVAIRLELAALCRKTKRKKLAEIWENAANEAKQIKLTGGN